MMSAENAAFDARTLVQGSGMTLMQKLYPVETGIASTIQFE